MFGKRFAAISCVQGCLEGSCLRTGPGFRSAGALGPPGGELTVQASPGQVWGPGSGPLPPSPLQEAPCFRPRGTLHSSAVYRHCPPPHPSLTSPCFLWGWGSTGEPRLGGCPTAQVHTGKPEVPLPPPGGPSAPEETTASGPCGQRAVHTGRHLHPAQRGRLPTAPFLPSSCPHPCRGPTLLPSLSGMAPGLTSPPTAPAQWPVPGCVSVSP